MIRRNPVTAIAVALLIIALLDLALLISGYRVLVSEKRVSEVIVPGSFHSWGSVEPVTDDRIVCSYFTGRSVQTTAVPQSDLDECPFTVHRH